MNNHQPFKQYYYDDNIREICHGIKENDIECMDIMVSFVLNQDIIKSNDILIPAPQHSGHAEYTLKIAEKIAKETNATVKDVLYSLPRHTLYEQKKQSCHYLLSLLAKENIKSDNYSKGRLFFVDNVIDTGTTLRTAERTLNCKLIPLVYAYTN